MNRPKFVAEPDLEKKKKKNIKQKKKTKQDSYLAPVSQRQEASVTIDPKNNLSDYKMEINRGVIDYMCYLEQLISDTKKKAANQKQNVAKVILNLSRYFDVPDVNQSSIHEFLDNAIVQGRELEYQTVLEKLEWFEVLQEKRFISFLFEKPKEEDNKQLIKQTPIASNIVKISLNHDNGDYEPKKKNKAKPLEYEETLKKKRKTEFKQENGNKYDDYPTEQMRKFQRDQHLTEMMTKLLGDGNTKGIDLNMIQGFEQYLSYPNQLSALQAQMRNK